MRVLLAGLGMILVGASAIVVVVRADEPVSFQEIEESLTCQCGCGLTVHSCNHVNCGSALPLRAEIRAKMDAGKSKQQILAEFTDKYGEKILSSPTTSGFNLVAWVLPFVVVGSAIAIVLLIVGRWGRQARPAPAAEPASSPRVRSPQEEMMERELKSFDS